MRRSLGAALLVALGAASALAASTDSHKDQAGGDDVSSDFDPGVDAGQPIDAAGSPARTAPEPGADALDDPTRSSWNHPHADPTVCDVVVDAPLGDQNYQPE